jgi:signal transduction histidine kinase
MTCEARVAQTTVQLLTVPGAPSADSAWRCAREALERAGTPVLADAPAPAGEVENVATLVVLPSAFSSPGALMSALLELPLRGCVAVLGPPDLLADHHEALLDAGLEPLPAGNPLAVRARIEGWLGRLRAGVSTRSAALESAVSERDLAALHRESLLRTVTRDRDDLLRFVSHDIRTPITVLAGHCQMLAEGLLPPSRLPESLAAIRRQADNLGRLTRGWLAGRARSDLALPGPARGVSEILAPLVEAAAERGAEREVAVCLLPPADVPVPRLPRATLRALLEELLDAALRSMSARGRLDVACEERDGAALLRLVAVPAWSTEVAARVREGCAESIASLARLGGGAMVSAAGLEISLPAPELTDPGPVFVLGPDEDAVETVVGVLRGAMSDVRGERSGPGALAGVRAARPSAVVLVGERLTPWLLAALGGAPVVALGVPREPGTSAACFEWLPWPVDGRAALAAVQRARAFGDRLRGGLTARPVDPETGLPLPGALLAHARAVAPTGGTPRLLLVSGIEVVDAPPDEAEAARGAAMRWLAGQLDARCRPGDLVGLAGARQLGLSASGRTDAELAALREELALLLVRTRPRIGVTRRAVGARVEIVELLAGANEQGGGPPGYGREEHAS